MGSDEPIGLYVHIPFCVRKCHYCNFVISTASSAELRENYFKAIEAEAAEARRRYGPRVFDTVYIGGGTPSALAVDEMGRLFGILEKNFSWKSDAEITCEMNPGDTDAAKFLVLRKLGVNRLSMGVQTTDPGLLGELNRSHSVEDSRDAARMARDAGFDNISMDLILRLPGQTVEMVRRSLEDLVAWGARQVVLYDLAVHEGTVFGHRRREGRLPLPPEEVHEKMFLAAEEILGREGFGHYEISTFAKPGFESRHNLIYWCNQPYLGLGPGAFSYMDGCRYLYAGSAAGYIEKALCGDWSRDEEDFLTEEECQMETLLTGIRLEPGVDLTGLPLALQQAEPEIPELTTQGLVTYDGRHLRLTSRGRHLAETVLIRLSRNLSHAPLKIP